MIIILRGLSSILSHFRNEWNAFNNNSNQPPLYTGSQRLNAVIYRLINHSTDWAQIGVTSIGHQFDFQDVVYQISHCNVYNRRRNVVLQLLNVQNVRKIHVSV